MAHTIPAKQRKLLALGRSIKQPYGAAIHFSESLLLFVAFLSKAINLFNPQVLKKKINAFERNFTQQRALTLLDIIIRGFHYLQS